MNWIRAAKNLLSDIFERLFGSKTADVPRIDDSDLKLYLSYFDDQALDLAHSLSDGDLTPSEWFNAMKTELEKLHTTAYIIYRGGVDSLGQEDIDLMSQLITEQLQYLKAWAEQMNMSGEIPSIEYIMNRVRQYEGAVNETVQRAALTALGIPELPAYPADGKTSCLSHCKCSWEIDPVESGYDLYWTLGVAEHCPECEIRAAKYAPLKIRNGVIVA